MTDRRCPVDAKLVRVDDTEENAKRCACPSCPTYNDCMAVVDLVDLVDQRLAQLAEDDEDIRAEETYMHQRCGVNNFSQYSTQQIEWFKRSYRLAQVFYYGRYHYSFCPRCQNVLRNQFLEPMPSLRGVLQ